MTGFPRCLSRVRDRCKVAVKSVYIFSVMILNIKIVRQSINLLTDIPS